MSAISASAGSFSIERIDRQLGMDPGLYWFASHPGINVRRMGSPLNLVVCSLSMTRRIVLVAE